VVLLFLIENIKPADCEKLEAGKDAVGKLTDTQLIIIIVLFF
jgi:hypothetical protein